MHKSNVLILDIETSPIKGYFWDIGKQYITSDQIIEDWFVMAWSAKWLGDPVRKLYYYDLRNKKVGNDLPILKPLWDLLNEADIVITQNGKKFDSRKINARFMIHKLNPPKPYAHIDTYLLSDKVAAFTSHKLGYLTDKLCKTHKKTHHAKYPGLSLWKECLKNNIEAWNEMKEYNIKDVLSTEELYESIKAWAPESMPKIYPMTKDADTCSTCGYFGEMRAGRDRIRKTGVYTQNSCPKCGSWQIAKKKQAGK